MTSEAKNQEGKSFAGADRRRTRDHEDYFNSQFDAKPLYLEPGQSIWSEGQKDMIVATLGTGVMVCIHDEDLKLGSAAYVLVPDEILAAFPHFGKIDPETLDAALQPIVDCIGHLKRRGAAKKRIYVRLIGGADIPGMDADRGMKTYVFVREYITRKGLSMVNEDLGGTYVRRVHFFPATGRMVRRFLRRESDYKAVREMENKI